MKRRFSLLVLSLLAVGSLQLSVAPSASACADPNCPWSPVTWPVRQFCRGAFPEICPI